MNQKNQLRKNPSRETCESIIRRILMTELTQNGKNRHFRKATDFMSYFESLYPASDALTKQVQRAVQSLHMPKDAGLGEGGLCLNCDVCTFPNCGFGKGF